MNFKFSLSFLGATLLSLVASATPAISYFSPNYGWSNSIAVPGSVINIVGSGFYPGTLEVRFNGVLATSFQATDTFGTNIEAQIRIGTPSGTGPVVVKVNGIQANTNNGIFFTVIGPNEPYVTDFSPGSGVAGSTLVTFNGAHFTSVNSVKFNGVAASFGPITDDETFTATVPASAQTGPISLSKPGAATFTSRTNFYVSPTIISFSPSRGRALTNVVIRGTSFTNATVKFGSANAASVFVDSNSQITAIAPNGVVTGPISVIAPGGTFITSSNFVVLPTISTFTPGFGAQNTPVTITGANLDAGSFSVTFNGVTAAHGTPSFGSVAVTAPASTTGPIVVTTIGGSVTSSVSFYYSPAITSFTPTNSAVGTTVKVTGINFLGATNLSDVTFNGISATSFVVSNNTTIGAVVPGGILTGPISVTTPAGMANSTGLFYGTPGIISFNPTQGTPGDSVKITGTNFLGTTAVLFNGTNASFVVTNNTTIGAVVPNNASSGPITVIAPGGTNTSGGTFTVNYTSDISVFITNAPNPVFVTNNLVLTITVANYTGPHPAFNVMFTNTLPMSFALKSATTTQGTLNTNAFPLITGALGTIPAGNSAVVTLTVAPQAIGDFVDNASVASDGTDQNLANNSASNTTTVWPFPVLGIQNLTNRIKIFWPAALSNFTLLYKSNLIPISAAWFTNTNTRVISGTNISVTETNFGDMKFFRLKQ